MGDDLRAFTRPGWRIRYLERVGSTNDVVEAAGRAGEQERLVVLAEEQTAGRGRLDRRWAAPPGTCLLMSLLFRPAAPFAWHAARTTMLCGLSLVEAMETRLDGAFVQIKWPNDLIVSDPDGAWRKVAGMLSEVGLEAGEPAFLVVGIGLNVNVPPAVLPSLAPNASSLLAEVGRPIDRGALLDAFLERVAYHAARLRAGIDPAAAWRQHLAWVGARVEVHTPTARVTGIMEGVDDDGALVLDQADGVRAHFPVGDVSLRRPSH